MIGVDVVGLVTVLTASDPAVCDQAALTELVATAHRVRCWLDGYEARIAVRADELAACGVGDPGRVVLADGGRRSGRAARDAAARGGVCAELPGVFDALASGAVSAGHVDAIARLVRRLDDAGRAELRELETAIVGSATRSVVAVFEREMRDLERILTRAVGDLAVGGTASAAEREAVGRQGHRDVPHPPRARSRSRRHDRLGVRRRRHHRTSQARRRPHPRPAPGRRPRRPDHRRPHHQPPGAGGVGAHRPRHADPRTP